MLAGGRPGKAVSLANQGGQKADHERQPLHNQGHSRNSTKSRQDRAFSKACNRGNLGGQLADIRKAGSPHTKATQGSWQRVTRHTKGSWQSAESTQKAFKADVRKALTILEAVQAPHLGGLPGLWRLLMHQHHAVYSVALCSQLA